MHLLLQILAKVFKCRCLSPVAAKFRAIEFYYCMYSHTYYFELLKAKELCSD